VRRPHSIPGISALCFGGFVAPWRVSDRVSSGLCLVWFGLV
jgi:hypothetical protein